MCRKPNLPWWKLGKVRSYVRNREHHNIIIGWTQHPSPNSLTGAPPNSPHSSTRSLFTKIRRKASILSLTSPIIGGSGKKLSAQGGAGGGPCSSPRAFSLDDLVKTSVSTARSSKTHYIWVCYEPAFLIARFLFFLSFENGFYASYL